jgi:hypothetical protein
MTITKEKEAYNGVSKEKVYEKLVQIFGSTNISQRAVDLYPYSYDMTECEPHMPDFVVIP